MICNAHLSVGLGPSTGTAKLSEVKERMKPQSEDAESIEGNDSGASSSGAYAQSAPLQNQ